jgi:quercetin dioxygenase-like cupin family protein
MAVKKKTKTELHPVEGKVKHLAVLGEMTALLQRVRGNKSKTTTTHLVKSGPIRVQVLALDEGGEVNQRDPGGPFTLQCLLGRVSVSAQGSNQRLTTGDLLVADTAMPHEINAEEPSVLLLTVLAVAE